MRSSYKKEDVEILLKDITGLVKPQPTEEREKLIQSGRHYSEMLPIEYKPTPVYMEAYEHALREYAGVTAQAVGVLADKIIAKKGKEVVLVSLARAGIPIGILVKRYIRKKYHIEVPHYAISIIRDRGIDHNAMRYMLDRHAPKQLQFLDGWIGKGAILKELRQDLKDYPDVSAQLAVVADPAGVTELCGTHEDILIPSSCLNSTVSGLISRTFLREDIIGPQDFHGAVYYGELADEDLSEQFLTEIEQQFVLESEEPAQTAFSDTGLDEVHRIMQDYGVENVNFVKPGIGETTRVLLRRVPWKVLIRPQDMENPMLSHLIRLAKEKNVPIETYPLQHYRTCGMIKKMADV
ncbi:MAG: cysteine protease StiP family protein [Lachnospiraceae bacterium]